MQFLFFFGIIWFPVSGTTELSGHAAVHVLIIIKITITIPQPFHELNWYPRTNLTKHIPRVEVYCPRGSTFGAYCNFAPIYTFLILSSPFHFLSKFLPFSPLRFPYILLSCRPPIRSPFHLRIREKPQFRGIAIEKVRFPPPNFKLQSLKTISWN